MIRPTRGFTLLELLAVLLVLVILMGFTLPIIEAMTCDDLKNVSIKNLQTLHVAHVMYAADWDGRQVTYARDDLGAYGGNAQEYNEAHGCQDPFDEGCQPPVVAGLDCVGTVWAYDLPGGGRAIQPINFPGGPYWWEYWGSFRMPNMRPLHDYVNGRVHDPTFYAPKDTTVMKHVSDCLDARCEFDPECNPGWSSYCLSPAAMFHPGVFSLNPDTGYYWRSPWNFSEGYASPAVSQAEYPSQKTRMIEHSWLQKPAAPCNPSFSGCEPYYFNHGLNSVPMTLFFDGHVNGLSPSEAMRSEARVLAQTDGQVPLWSRDTPFGNDGYLIADGYDFAETSYHILTVDGIRGRDTLE